MGGKCSDCNNKLTEVASYCLSCEVTLCSDCGENHMNNAPHIFGDYQKMKELLVLHREFFLTSQLMLDSTCMKFQGLLHKMEGLKLNANIMYQITKEFSSSTITAIINSAKAKESESKPIQVEFVREVSGDLDEQKREFERKNRVRIISYGIRNFQKEYLDKFPHEIDPVDAIREYGKLLKKAEIKLEELTNEMSEEMGEKIKPPKMGVVAEIKNLVIDTVKSGEDSSRWGRTASKQFSESKGYFLMSKTKFICGMIAMAVMAFFLTLFIIAYFVFKQQLQHL